MKYGNQRWSDNEITCPHCGWEVSESWELEEDDGEYVCEECEKEFLYNRVREISYHTRPIK